MKPQRYLAAAGLGSRRACEELIKANRVTVDGGPLTFNMELIGTEDIRVDGKPVAAQSPVIYIALNKPAGYISDRGVSDARSALDLVEAGARLFPVGRLDIDATGLLLLTNDGELAYTLTHPKYEHEKEYRVLVEGAPSDHALSQWRQGVLLDGDTRPTAPAKVKRIDGPDVPGATWLAVRLREGRKRQIKRVARAVGHPVLELQRIRIGTLLLGDLAPGKWRFLTPVEVASLKGEA